jgi:site-specific recombinase XerD
MPDAGVEEHPERRTRLMLGVHLGEVGSATGMRMPPLHPQMLRPTYVTTMLDAGVDRRDVQIAARRADPRTTMRYDRARNQLDRHPNYIVAAYMASGT